MDLLVWGLLIAIGVSDAQRHRIPNKYVLVLFLVVVASLISTPSTDWLDHVKGGVVTFFICFGLFMVRAMAGGDVKLLAVIGVWLGLSRIGDAMMWVILAGGIVGLFYAALNIASSDKSLSHQVRGYCLRKVTPGFRHESHLVIPFAPVIVIGLAYYSYIY
ncbi:A24 family peptidase [Vibrio rotiferianus]|uniref:A24 family peptidase n=1 Tax=Vibrio rotiferianus TaxID=190895 RepID=UPI0002376090|nr:A24 family peptidase [Vibrio rotiferianus]